MGAGIKASHPGGMGVGMCVKIKKFGLYRLVWSCYLLKRGHEAALQAVAT